MSHSGETRANDAKNAYYEVKAVHNEQHYYDDIADNAGYYAASGIGRERERERERESETEMDIETCTECAQSVYRGFCMR